MVPSRRGNRSVSIHRDSWIDAVRPRHGGAHPRPGLLARRQAKLVGASATFEIRRRSIEVGNRRRRAGIPFPLAADYAQMRPEIPWHGDRTLTVGLPCACRTRTFVTSVGIQVSGPTHAQLRCWHPALLLHWIPVSSCLLQTSTTFEAALQGSRRYDLRSTRFRIGRDRYTLKQTRSKMIR